jgi:hypothetical protein
LNSLIFSTLFGQTIGLSGFFDKLSRIMDVHPETKKRMDTLLDDAKFFDAMLKKDKDTEQAKLDEQKRLEQEKLNAQKKEIEEKIEVVRSLF